MKKKKTHQFYNENSNEAHHTSSRIPYFGSPSESKKWGLEFWLHFWQFHLGKKRRKKKNNHFYAQGIKKEVTKKNLQKQEKERAKSNSAHTPGGSFAAWILKTGSLEVLIIWLRWLNRETFPLRGWSVTGFVRRREDDERRDEGVAILCFDFFPPLPYLIPISISIKSFHVLPGPLLKFVEMGCSRDGIEWTMALSLLCFSHLSGFISLNAVHD